MEPTELLLYSGTRTVPVGADWRGKLPLRLKAKDTGEGKGEVSSDSAAIEQSDKLSPHDTSGKLLDQASEPDGPHPDDSDEDELHEICWHRPIGQCPEHAPGETEVVQAPLDFIVGDLVTWPGGKVPEADVGAVANFTDNLDAQVVFCASKDIFTVPQKELKLHLPSTNDDVATVYKTLTVQHTRLVMEQRQADQDHSDLISKLQSLSDKELRKWLKQKYPDRHGEKIDKRDAHDQRHQHEKRKHWKLRVHEMHAEELATEEKAEKDQERAVKIAELATLKERARLDYEHANHLSSVGTKAARVQHAQHMHEAHEKWDKKHKRVLHVKTKAEKEAKRLRDEEDYQKLLAAREQLDEEHAELQKFAASVGIHKNAEPGGVAGLAPKYNSSKIVLVQGFNGVIETAETIKGKFAGFGMIEQVIEKTTYENDFSYDDMDWALVVFAAVEGAKAALVGAHALQWADQAVVKTRLLGHTTVDMHFLFAAVDSDNSGSLSMRELKVGLHWLGVSQSRADEIIRADENSDGKLQWPEFLDAAQLITGSQIDDKATTFEKPLKIEPKTRKERRATRSKSKLRPFKQPVIETSEPEPEPEENHNPVFNAGELFDDEDSALSSPESHGTKRTSLVVSSTAIFEST